MLYIYIYILYICICSWVLSPVHCLNICPMGETRWDLRESMHESTGPSGEEEAPESSWEGRFPRSHGEMAVEKKTTCGRDIPADILGLYWVQDLLMTGMASFRRFQVEWKAIDLDDLWSSEQSDHMQAIVQKGPQPLRGMLRRSARL